MIETRSRSHWPDPDGDPVTAGEAVVIWTIITLCFVVQAALWTIFGIWLAS